MTTTRRPVRIAVVNDYEIVVAGIAAVLEPFADRVEVVELDSSLPPVSEVDLILYDTFGQPQGQKIDLAQVVGKTGARVVVYSWNVEDALIDSSFGHGVAGYVAKSASAEELVEALERIHDGEHVAPQLDTADVDTQLGRWPGQEVGLSARESEVLALLVQGMSNREIAEQAFLGVNTVKTYLRTAYRKIGVTRRTQAVLWGIEHGFSPDRVRHVGLDTSSTDDEREIG